MKFDLSRYQRAIVDERLDGWLFTSFRNRDQLTHQLLGLSTTRLATRPWYYLVPAQGEPLKIEHAIEQGSLAVLPGRRMTYASRDQLRAALATFPGGRLAAQYSAELPILSFLDHGTALLFLSAGFTLVSSASLIQRAVGVLDVDGIASHDRAAGHLYDIVSMVWNRIETFFERREPLTEGMVQSWIMDEIDKRALVCDHPAIVASGRNSGNPHYEPQGGGRAIENGSVVQLDLWAKERIEGSIYADISWVGVTAAAAPSEVARVFDAVRQGRERAVQLIGERFESGKPITGAEVDGEVRELLARLGFSAGLRHRTGHGIDTELHGYGVNLDSVEFPDSRTIIEGSCFSVEPGLYFDEFGLRTEINVYVRSGRPHISGGPRQEQLLVLRPAARS